MGLRLLLLLVLTAACGSSPSRSSRPVAAPAATPPAPAARAENRFGPLEVGAEYLGYRKVSSEPFLSRAHSNRWVEVYVDEGGADAYVVGDPVPVGTTVVKTSWLDQSGRPGPVAGPIWVMRKEPAGYDLDHGDWYFAVHWAKPTRGAPVYWRGKTPEIAFCAIECHDSYDDSLGGLTPSSLVPR
jgi:hypothetical protein